MGLKTKKLAYISMVILVFSWGLEYVMAKSALEVVKPVTLIFLRYFVAFVFLMIIKLIFDRRFYVRKNDIAFFLVCAFFGDIVYFASEYMAMSYLPISIVTLVLSLVPAVSIVVEIFLYKRKPTIAIIIGCIISIFGVALIVGADFSQLLAGKWIGYLLVFMALIAWNIYNFMTARLTRNYNSFDLTLYQIISAILLCGPYAIFNLPEASAVDSGVIISVLYLGLVSASLCFLIYVNAIAVIGVTPTALFANMLPVTSTFFGWLFVGEMITPIQIVGGVIVIGAGSVVIWLKSKKDAEYLSVHTD